MVAIECAGRTAVAVIIQIRAVSQDRLDKRIGTISSEELITVEEALRTVLDLS
jgi:mRNA-degrading endonuclease toxin of MazEF toxin-antitoxin module